VCQYTPGGKGSSNIPFFVSSTSTLLVVDAAFGDRSVRYHHRDSKRAACVCRPIFGRCRKLGLTIWFSEVSTTYNNLRTEFPGVVARPIGTFKTSSDYHYQTMCCNVDLLKIIQIGITLADEEGDYHQDITTWQFNFRFSIKSVRAIIRVVLPNVTNISNLQ
jgi:hypothetical protein